MAFDFTKPNSTPRRSAPIVLSGVSALGSLGVALPSPNLFQAPEIAAFLVGVQAAGSAGSVMELPNIVFLTGVEAVGHLSDDESGPGGSPNFVTLTGIRVATGTGFFGGSVPAGVARPLPVSTLHIPNILKALQVPGGPCQGAFFYNGNKGLVNWYAANVGLTSIVQFLNATDLDTYIRPYLDCYVSRLNGDASINDVAFNAGTSNLSAIGALPQVDEDAYAATFIRLAYRYTLASQNYAWFDTNKGTLANILDNMIVNNLRSDGLVSRNAGSRRIQGDTAYLKNNCEAWAALNEFSSLLNTRNDTFNAARYANLASMLSQAIDAVLWVATGPHSPAFKPHTDATGLAPTFNPYVVGQVYPQAMGVPGLQGRYAQAYTFVNNQASGWESLGYDPQPWMVLGLTAALRGDTTRANAQTLAFETSYNTAPDAAAINELGMYQRIKSILAGLPQA